jgi:alpha-tubulin suppressor-like RCC1 family protein
MAVTLPGATGPPAAMAAGFHSLVATTTGELFSFGSNRTGQLGYPMNSGTFTANPTPQPVTLTGATGPVVAVAAGEEHSLALTSTGQLFAFGSNSQGQLGGSVNEGTSDANPTPMLVSLPGASGPVVAIAAGESFSLALTSTGQLYSFGGDRYGELGDGRCSEGSHAVPMLVSLPGATGQITRIAAGAEYALAATSTGEVFSWGQNAYGALGRSAPECDATPARVDLPGQDGVISQLAAGWAHTLALTSSGQVYGWGSNYYGELASSSGNETRQENPPATLQLAGVTEPITAVATGRWDSFVRTASGQIYSFGEGRAGQLGVAAQFANPTPLLIPLDAPVASVAVEPTAEYTLLATSTEQPPVPVVKKISPKKGPASGGTSVTITGSHFEHATAVRFGGVPAQFVVESDSTIIATSPADTDRRVDIQVTTTGGTSPITHADRFKFGPPSVTGLSVSAGSVEGGAHVRITGTGFGLGTGATVVSFGKAVASSVDCPSTTECELQTPRHVAGTVDVLVNVGGRKSKKTAADRFSYE